MRNIKSEWIKFRSLKTSFILLWGIPIVIVSLFAFLQMTAFLSRVNNPEMTEDTINFVKSSGGIFGMMSEIHLFLQFILAIFMIKIVTDEFQYGTMQGTVLATPRRGKVVAAKLIFAGVFAVVYTAIIHLYAFFIANLLQAGQLDNASISSQLIDALPVLLCNIVAYVLFTFFSIGIAFLVRNFAVAVIIMLASSIFLHMGLMLIRGNLENTVFSKITNIIVQSGFEDTFYGGSNFIFGIIVLGVWTILSVTAGFLAFQKKDI
ncbi:MAG: ABC transporter permease [Clostridiales Family XIII bacterium]|jgi:ABC-type transport system involved in multi-copper enzyme maturation permease subunit|nr:ABC transporter permease [Clostridiales Family XIII bacterium]